MEKTYTKDRLALLLDHIGVVKDPREVAKVKFPLRGVFSGDLRDDRGL